MSDRSFRLAPSDIDQAFQRNEFCVVFQPKVDLATQRVTGAEVFVRWQHPQYGLLPPGLFSIVSMTDSFGCGCRVAG